MLKAEIYDGICLVSVITKEDIMHSLSRIKKELKIRGVKIYYSTMINFFGKDKKIVIALGENDIYPLLSSLGCIKEEAKIKNYSINCSNCLITWEGAGVDIAKSFENEGNKIKLFYEAQKCGGVICESEIKHRIYAKICGKSNF